MISHVRGGQREERLARLVGGNGCDASGADSSLGRLRFAPLQVGATIGATVTTVCASSDVAGVGTVRAVRDRLAHFSVLLGMVAVGAAGAALLVRGFTARTVGAQSRLSGGGVTPLVSGQLLLSGSCRAAAVDPGAGGGSMRRVGLVPWGRVSIGGTVIA